MIPLQYSLSLLCYLLLALRDQALCAKDITVTPAEPLVKMGDAVTLTCETTCPKGKPSWRELDDSDATQNTAGNKSFLHIAAVQQYHEGMYVCTSTNCITQKRETVYLRVYALPMAVLSTMPGTTPGQAEMVTCTLTDVYYTSSYSVQMLLFQDFKEIHSELFREYTHFQSFTLSYEIRMDTGITTYQCQAALIIGSQKFQETASLTKQFQVGFGGSSTTENLPKVKSTTLLPTTSRDKEVEYTPKTTGNVGVDSTTEDQPGTTKWIPTTTTGWQVEDTPTTTGNVGVDSTTEDQPGTTKWIPTTTTGWQVEDTPTTTGNVGVDSTTEDQPGTTKWIPTTTTGWQVEDIPKTAGNVGVDSTTEDQPGTTKWIPTTTTGWQVEGHTTKTTNMITVKMSSETEMNQLMTDTSTSPSTKPDLETTSENILEKTLAAVAFNSTTTLISVFTTVGTVATFSCMGFLIRWRKRKLSNSDHQKLPESC
ncbi:hypothetical protein UPYG_G00033670 [Umbra pygmaea]|uniref:Ig-like domain-containing protein n=1 Tax=Umbra pygmaea TaxID=75934 RepID=A0ABD0Y747_UMBPY